MLAWTTTRHSRPTPYSTSAPEPPVQRLPILFSRTILSLPDSVESFQLGAAETTAPFSRRDKVPKECWRDALKVISSIIIASSVPAGFRRGNFGLNNSTPEFFQVFGKARLLIPTS